MILYIIVIVVVCGMAFFVSRECGRMQKDLDRLEDLIANVALSVAKDREILDVQQEEIEELKEANGDKGIEKLLEKKWEDAIQTISNFDPFAQGDDK